MSLTYGIDHISGTTFDISVPVPESLIGEQGRDPLSAKDELSTKYVSLAGDPAFPASITYRATDTKRAGESVKRIAVTRVNWVNMTDTVTGVVTRKQIVFSTSINVPTGFTVEAEDVTTGFLDHVACVIPNTGSSTAAYIAKLLFGITAVR